MSRLTVFQIYAMIRQLEASIRGYEATGNLAGARRSRKKLAQYEAEIKDRVKALVDSGERMAPFFTEVG